MVLRIPEAGLHLESSDKLAETLPLQAFAFTLSDNVIEDLISCVQNGEDVKLSLGNVPVSVFPAVYHRTIGGWQKIMGGLLSLRREILYNRRLHSQLRNGQQPIVQSMA